MTAWFAPLPPNPSWKSSPWIVSPAAGTRGAYVMRSIIVLPTTASFFCASASFLRLSVFAFIPAPIPIIGSPPPRYFFRRGRPPHGQPRAPRPEPPAARRW